MRASPKLWSMGLLAASVLIGLAAGWFVFGRDLQPNAASTALPVFALVTTPTFVHGAPAPVVGAPVPDFTLAALDGSSISLSDFAGQPVLINFPWHRPPGQVWATWCAPCRLEMPELVRVYEAHKADGFVLLAVNLTYLDVREDVQPYVDEFSMTFPVLFDEDGTVASDLYRMRGQPLSVFVNRDGLIASIRVGAMTPEIVDEYVAEILK